MYDFENKLSIITSAIEQLQNNLSIHFPMMQGQLNDIISTMRAMMNHHLDIERDDILNGCGHNALFLRQLHEHFPEKNLDRVVVDGLPNIYEWKNNEYQEFRNYVNKTLEELPQFDLSQKEIGIYIEKSKWFCSQKKEFFDNPVFKKEHAYLPTINSLMETGFYHVYNRTNSSYHQKEWMLVIQDGENTHIIAEHSGYTSFIKVPIEHKTVETNDTLYANPVVLKEKFIELLYQLGYTKEADVTSESLYTEIKALVEELDIPTTPDSEFGEMFKPKLLNDWGGECFYPETPISFIWNKYDYSGIDLEIARKEHFKIRTSKLLIDIMHSETKNITSTRITGIGAFDLIPFRVRQQIRDLIIREIKTTAEYHQTAKTAKDE